MEKRGVIEPGRTPSEETEEKQAADDLEQHVTKRAADAVQEGFREKNSDRTNGK